VSEVNVVPIITKSDSLSLDERDAFKSKVGLRCCLTLIAFYSASRAMQIREELVYHNIRLYPFDTDKNEEEELQLNESIRVRMSS